MCLGVPMKVVEIDGDMAVAEITGVRRSISLQLVEDVKVGDYVIVHAGFAIQVLDEAEAEETIRLLQEFGVQSG
ncbi:MAG: HypC/HybG/HupF family hydrogenase formation chaperone [bacterium]|jgi:hydrogenase expression/formation protein HypC|nr:HypC/HybG/HupF family hydrogenase formation chaperone [candidate division KSB1 bacterium]MDH7558707.1 HypC/HybG/HupF family hydrogenase formation chaperone [bacterium]